MTEVFTLLKEAISRNEVIETLDLLDKVPLEDMSQEKTDELLQNLLTVAYKSNSGDVATVIIQEFDKLVPNDDRILTTFTRLFGFPLFSDLALKWIIDISETDSYAFVIEDLLKFDSDPALLPSFVRATDLYNITDQETFQVCLDSAKEEDNDNGIWFFSSKLSKVSDFAPDAPYVENFQGGKVPVYSDLQIPEVKIEEPKIPRMEGIIDLLTAGLQNMGIEESKIVETKNLLRTELSGKTKDELEDLVRPILLGSEYSKLNQVPELFRIVGPVNPTYGSDLTFDHICYRICGGHSLMYCTCFEIDVEDQPRDDWFTGACQKCLKRIKSRAHAMRRPIASGGYRGCYCSAKCVKNSLPEVNILVNLMLDEILKLLYKYGLQDRIENPEEELPEMNTIEEVTSQTDSY